MKKIDFRQFSHLEKLATLTHLYLELRLSLAEARRAAETDLQMDSHAAVLETTRLSGDRNTSSALSPQNILQQSFLDDVYDNDHCCINDNYRCLSKRMNNQQTSKKPRILVLGSTG